MFELALYLSCIAPGVESSMVGAIIETESSGRPYAFNVNNWQGKRFSYKDVNSSVAACEAFTEHNYTVDVGLMAINSNNLSRFNLTMEEGFDVCTNIKYGTIIFHENLSRALKGGHNSDDAKKIALSFYNTGSSVRGMENGYVDRVWKKYKRFLRRENGGDNAAR